MTSDCKFCHVPINWQKVEGKSVPYNIDGTPHRCKKPAPTAAPADKPLIGMLKGFTSGSATFLMLDGHTKTYANVLSQKTEWENQGYLKNPADQVWLEFSLDKNSFVVHPKRVRVPDNAGDIIIQEPDNEPAPVKTGEVKTGEEPVQQPVTEVVQVLPRNTRVTIGFTISVAQFESIRIEVVGDTKEECKGILADTIDILAPNHPATKDLLQRFKARVL